MTDAHQRATLRAALRARRAALPVDAVAQGSAAITGVILASDAWREAESIAAFVGVRSEPDTSALLEAAWSSGKALWLPRIHDGALELVLTHARDQLVSAGFGLLEPVPREPAKSIAEIAPALVIVPGLAFGRDGARIGFGRGYYDRALAPVRARTDVVRMGLCFAAFLNPPEGPIPIAAHDVPMHAVATEHGIVLCATAKI